MRRTHEMRLPLHLLSTQLGLEGSHTVALFTCDMKIDEII
jgi:hypothetical protein